MSTTKRYYARTIVETGEVIVEKSDILDKETYVIDVASREESSPFKILSESSDDYAKAVKAFFAIETDTVVETPVFI